MPLVTAGTPFRQIGDLSRTAWRSVLRDADSPLLDELDAILELTPGYGALALSQAYKESSLGKAQNARRTNNALGLMDQTGSALVVFGRWADSFAEFGRRLNDPVYKNGVYMPRDMTLRQYIYTYVGGPGCWSSGGRACANGETKASVDLYLQQTIDRINAWRKIGAGPKPEPMPDPPAPVDPWRPYPFPMMVELIVQKPYEGAGFDRVALRRDRIRGFCTHITEGTGSIEWLAAFFSTGGERARDALTDLSIGRDGRIGLMNDWRDPDRGGTRAPWANGGTNGLEGPGIAFYRKYPDVNSVLVSCEHIAREGEWWSDAQIASSIEIRTALAQERRCRWDSYPIHQDWGVSIEQYHAAFATKRCPSVPYLDEIETIILGEVGKKLEKHQTGSTNASPGPPVEPEPAWKGVFDLPLEFFVNEFGTLTRFNPDGSVDELPFDPTGPVSLAWMERAGRKGTFPEAEQLRTWDSNLAPGKESWVSFADGSRLFLPLEDGRAAWVWVDEVILPAEVEDATP